MKDIREQLVALGFMDQSPLTKPVTAATTVSSQRAERKKSIIKIDGKKLLNKLENIYISSVLNGRGLEDFYKFCNEQRLKLNPNLKRMLKAHCTSAAKKSFFDVKTVSLIFKNLRVKPSKEQSSPRIIFIEGMKTSTPRKKKSTKVISFGGNKNLTSEQKISWLKDLPTIGLGLASKIKLPKVRNIDVIVDEHTKGNKLVEKRMLYAAGYSLKDQLEE